MKQNEATRNTMPLARRGWPRLWSAAPIALLFACLSSAVFAADNQDDTARAAADELKPAGTPVQVEDPNPAVPPETAPLSDSNAPARDDTSTVPGTIQRDALVMIGKDAVLKTNETADAVVAVGGSVQIYGKALDAVVAVAGDVEVQGEVGDAVVAVLGNVKLGPKARVGEVVSVGGKVEIAEGAVVEGQTQEIDFGMLGLATPEWLRNWFRECGLKLRPLSLGVPFVWGVFGAFLLLYVIVAALFPRPVRACVEDLMERPATTFLVGLLLMILIPLVLTILAITGIGAFVVPFLVAAIAFGGIIGKVALIEGIGFAVTRALGAKLTDRPLPALLLGSLVIALLYLVPILGLIGFSLMLLWALGCAMTAAIGGLRRELPARAPQTGLATPLATGPGSSAFDPVQGAGFTPGTGTGIDSATATPTMPVPPLIAVEEALAHPKASFWERMGAGFLDIVLVSIIGNLVGGAPLGFLVALAYFAGLWTWKGTTIGGIVLGLKVVRMDGQPVNFLVAIVRGLAAAFSIVVLFLGFLWIAWDKDKQGWHDKIAGTCVLKLPRGTPLVCF